MSQDSTQSAQTSGDAASQRIAFLHVGAPKTGTTFLQQAFWKNRERLLDDGVCYPLAYPFEHFHATLGLRGMPWNGRWDPQWEGAWERLTERARESDARKLVLSNELLGGASEKHARRAVEKLAPYDVHVVFTARDLARQMPSGWQEHLKHQHAVGLDEFLEDLISKGTHGRYGRLFWSLHDWEAVLRRWSAAVPAENIHVITVPPPDAPRGTLWERVCTVLGLDPQRYDTDVKRSNVSVGAVEAELLRQVNAMVDDRLSRRDYGSAVRQHFVGTVLAARTGGPRITLPPHRLPWVSERSEAMMAQIGAAGYNVVGDLGELRPASRAGETRQPGDVPSGHVPSSEVPSSEVLDAAVEAAATLVHRMPPRRPDNDALHQRVKGLEEELARRRRQPVQTLVREIGQDTPAAMRIRKAWQRMRKIGNERQ